MKTMAGGSEESEWKVVVVEVVVNKHSGREKGCRVMYLG